MPLDRTVAIGRITDKKVKAIWRVRSDMGEVSLVDAHVLASTLLTGCYLRTFDKPLRRAAAALKVLV